MASRASNIIFTTKTVGLTARCDPSYSRVDGTGDPGYSRVDGTSDPGEAWAPTPTRQLYPGHYYVTPGDVG